MRFGLVSWVVWEGSVRKQHLFDLGVSVFGGVDVQSSIFLVMLFFSSREKEHKVTARL